MTDVGLAVGRGREAIDARRGCVASKALSFVAEQETGAGDLDEDYDVE